jgi:hypothetical protein
MTTSIIVGVRAAEMTIDPRSNPQNALQVNEQQLPKSRTP